LEEGAEHLRQQYEKLLERAERNSRRFRNRYRVRSSFKHYDGVLIRLKRLQDKKKSEKG
jgi:hypothetical protein